MENLDELLNKAKELDSRATPGPWMWDLRTAQYHCLLVTKHSGQYYVMDFARWGMQNAAPLFQVYERYEGEVRKRGSHGMVRADRLAKSYPGKEHHKGFDDYVNHPDAIFIAEGRGVFSELIAAVDQLRGALATAIMERDAAIADIERCCATCALCSKNNGTGEMCPYYDDCNQVDGDHWEWRGIMEASE